MKPITIEFSGPPGCGKATALRICIDALQAKGWSGFHDKEHKIIVVRDGAEHSLEDR